MSTLLAAFTRWLAAPADGPRYPVRSLLERAGAESDPCEARALRRAALAYLRVVR